MPTPIVNWLHGQYQPRKDFLLAHGVSFCRITAFGTSHTFVQPSSTNKKITPSAKIQTIDPVGLDEGATQSTREADYQLPKLNKLKYSHPTIL